MGFPVSNCAVILISPTLQKPLAAFETGRYSFSSGRSEENADVEGDCAILTINSW